ncbi:MAG: glutathione S-transferase family protein [Steroidobacteraceae bacterium]|jgi:glutathione S-transferase|nr:glutathione S-transferase family protein [Steroidobacteraceae bacterium]
MQLYAHPFSSYCQKVLIALYENATPFEWRQLGPEATEVAAQFAALWPLRRMPLLVDRGRTVAESSIIVEYLDLEHPGPVRFLPAAARDALEVRMLDRFFDQYVMTPMQRIVFDALRPPANRDPHGVADAHALLETAYDWLEPTLAGREWAAGATFGLADCAAAPALFYADWVHEIGPTRPTLRAYRSRLLARASFARAVDEARPYRAGFPLGAPDRD